MRWTKSCNLLVTAGVVLLGRCLPVSCSDRIIYFIRQATFCSVLWDLLLVAVTAAAAVTGACMMRSWDRAAGLRVAELTRARASDEWRTEERIAELEADLEESRELRTRLETKVRRKRVELAGLRGEHAALLRRYDGILVLKNGAVVERGQFAELMDRKGYFYSLYTVSQ